MHSATKRVDGYERRRENRRVSLCSRFGERHQSEVARLRESEGGGGVAAWMRAAVSLPSLRKRHSNKKNARGKDTERGPSFAHGSRWPKIDRVPAALKQSRVDVRFGFVVSLSDEHALHETTA